MSKTKVPGRSQSAAFMVAAANMGWQMAIVVLLPIFIGYKLDQRFNASPAFTVIGLVLAMFGTALVLWRQLRLFGPPPEDDAERRS
jgi:F0F1-type ATP synthase assembly protein I